jgi:DNA-binding GntR family transcriptional regulator
MEAAVKERAATGEQVIAPPPGGAIPGFGRVSTVEALALAIRERVLDGREPPGGALRERELVDLYRVSRHSMRTAVQLLVSDGLLRHEPHRGVFVPVFGPDDVRDIFRMRKLLELEAGHTFAKTRHAPEAARRAADVLESLGAGASWHEILVADVEFHAQLVNAVGSPRLTRVFRSITGELQLCLRQTQEIFSGYTGGVHHQLLDAIETGDHDAVDASFGKHLDGSMNQILEKLT